MQTVIKQIQIICLSVYDWALHKFGRWLLWMGHWQPVTKLNVSFVINSVKKVWTYTHISQPSDPYSCVVWLKATDISEAYSVSIITVEIRLDTLPTQIIPLHQTTVCGRI